MCQSAPVLMLMSLVTMVNSSVCTIGQELDPTEGRLRWIFSTPKPCGCSKVHIGGVNPRPVQRPYTPIFTDVPLWSRDAVRSHFKCQDDMNACVLHDGTSPCLNGGTCHVVANDHSKYICTCTADYTGEECQESVWTLKENITQSGTHLKTNLKKLNNWANSDNIRKIRFSLLRNGSSVVELVFNVTGVEHDENWFSQQNIITSPEWPYLTSPTSGIGLSWYRDLITVHTNSPHGSACEDHNGSMVVIAIPWHEECPWMYGWDAPIVMLYSLSKTPTKWIDVVTEIQVSPMTSGSTVSKVADGDCQTCYISGWHEELWISLVLRNPAKVGMVKLKTCPNYVKGSVTCPPPYSFTYKSDQGQTQCYHLSNAAMNKSSAHQYCKKLSEDRIAEWKVVEVNEKQEDDTVFQNSVDANVAGIWLGFTSYAGDWLLDSDKTNQTYFNWAGTGPGDQDCVFMNTASSTTRGWQATECSSDHRVLCEYTGDFGTTFSSAHVLLGQNNNITQAKECGVPPSDDSFVHFYTCAEPRATVSHVFVSKPTEYKDQLIICELVVYTVNDSLVGVADTITFETSTKNPIN